MIHFHFQLFRENSNLIHDLKIVIISLFKSLRVCFEILNQTRNLVNFRWSRSIILANLLTLDCLDHCNISDSTLSLLII